MRSTKTNEKYSWILNTTQFKADSKVILNVQVKSNKVGGLATLLEGAGLAFDISKVLKISKIKCALHYQFILSLH